MSAVFPDWPQKLVALQEAVHWAARGAATVVFRDANAADSARQARRPWIELAMVSIDSVGTDNVAVEDTGDGLIEVYTGQRNFTLELRAFSREQTLGEQAWYLADQVRTRLRRSAYARERWLVPFDIAIRELPSVVNLSPRAWDGRAEGEAVLEMMLATSVQERDTANAVGCIETVLLSGTIDTAPPLVDDEITVIPDGILNLDGDLYLDGYLVLP